MIWHLYDNQHSLLCMERCYMDISYQRVCGLDAMLFRSSMGRNHFLKRKSVWQAWICPTRWFILTVVSCFGNSPLIDHIDQEGVVFLCMCSKRHKMLTCEFCKTLFSIWQPQWVCIPVIIASTQVLYGSSVLYSVTHVVADLPQWYRHRFSQLQKYLWEHTQGSKRFLTIVVIWKVKILGQQ